ncbi:hypothetical protein IT415_02650 [bacterium]|nr:hypothetical protein [bacterium]
MKSISNINSPFSKALIAIWLIVVGFFVFVPNIARAADITSSISDVSNRSDNSCEWIADSKISCEGYDFYFVVTYTVQADKAVFRNMDENGNPGNVYLTVARTGTAAKGILTTSNTGAETPDDVSVELTANGKMYERRMYAPTNDLKDIDWSDSWGGANYDKATGKYTENGDAWFLCGLLSREGHTCIRQTTGNTMTIDSVQGDKIEEIYRSIKDGIDSAANCSSNSLSFILCPMLDGMREALEFLTGSGNAGDKGFLGDLLNVNPLTNGPTTLDRNGDTIDNYTYKVWASIRDVSLGLIIIFFVIIVFGNGIGMDAYTVKRSLPRLAFGALFTFASFFILQTLIDISNVFGNAVPDLILRASGIGAGAFAFNFNLGAGGGLAAIVLLLILYFLAFIAVLIGIAGLIARQLIIYALILTAPLACVMWILPNTEKLFKKWWSNLIKVLMMYPIVTGMLAISVLFQKIVGNDDGAPFAVRLVGMAAPLIALMAIPKTFKMGGELFAAGAGFLAGRASAGIDFAKGGVKKGAKSAASSLPKRMVSSDRGQKIAMGLGATPIIRSFGGKTAARKAAQLKSGRLNEAESLVKDMSSDQLMSIANRGNFQERTAAIGQLAKMGDRKALAKLSQSGGATGMAYNAASGRYAGDFGKNVDLRRIGGSYTDMSSLSDDALSQLSADAFGSNVMSGRITTGQMTRLANNTRAQNNMSSESLAMLRAYQAGTSEPQSQGNVEAVMQYLSKESTAPDYKDITVGDKTVNRAAPQIGTGTTAYRAGVRVRRTGEAVRNAPSKAADKVRDFLN